MSDGFKVSCGPRTAAQVAAAADELEKAIGESANGQRKPGKLPLEPMVVLIQFARDTLAKVGA